LRILTAWDGATLVGAIPLYVKVIRGPLVCRELRFLSTGEAELEEVNPDYLDLLCRPEHAIPCVDTLHPLLIGLDWDRVVLSGVRGESQLARLASSFRLRSTTRSLQADLSQGFDAYLARLSSKSRKQLRRLLREGERASARLEIAMPDNGDDAKLAFEELVRLHQAKWQAVGQPGAFAAPRFTQFHFELFKEWLPTGRVVLARLFVGQEVLVVHYGFVTGRRFDFYQSGLRPAEAASIESPGILAHLMLMQALTRQGIATYDFLGGVAPYKEHLATGHQTLIDLEAWRRSPRALALRSIEVARRGMGRLRSLGGRL
jgi:CelD/BcsL family acetyltransferase involved in cellulose biosynthesis